MRTNISKGFVWYSHGRYRSEGCGKWTCSFSDKEVAKKACEEAVENDLAVWSRHSDASSGFVSFCAPIEDIENLHKLVRLMLKHKLIPKTTAGKYYNIKFKPTESYLTEPYYLLEDFIDLQTGERNDSMFYYRICPFALFMNEGDKKIPFKDRFIGDIGINVRVKIIKNGKEILFKSKNRKTADDQKFKDEYVENFVDVCYDFENGVKLLKSETAKKLKDCEFEFSLMEEAFGYPPEVYAEIPPDISKIPQPFDITLNEALEVLKAHPEAYNCSDNNPASLSAYFPEEVKEET